MPGFLGEAAVPLNPREQRRLSHASPSALGRIRGGIGVGVGVGIGVGIGAGTGVGALQLIIIPNRG